MRPSDFAGTWYPGTSAECLKAIGRFERELPPSPPIKGSGLIVPHAGWVYSGATAWSAFAPLASDRIERVVIFGGHLGRSDPATILVCDAWSNPLRPVEIDREGIDRVASLHDFKTETDRRYRRDNGVELVLGFAAAAWPKARFIAIGVPPAELSVKLGSEIGGIFAGEADKTIFVGSTDLTHYGPGYDFAPAGIGVPSLGWADKNDRKFIDAIVNGDPISALASAQENYNACCPGAVAATMAACSAMNGSTETTITSVTNSHAVAGGTPRDFVGYAGIILK